jgi:P27 family predicted phage terminase small subunit
MGRRGPAPLPTALRVLRGETRPSQLNRTEPQPTANLPERASDLDPRARAVWDRIIADFGHTGVIRRLDTDALRCYCEAVSRYEDAAKLLRTSGPLIRGARGGDLVRNPLHQIVRDNADLMRSYARELGLTPAARAGLHLDTTPKASARKLDRYIRPTG